MMHYKDRTFCSHAGVCVNTKCDRWVNFDDAEESGMPVALADFKTDDCGYEPHPVWDKLVKAVTGEQE